MPSQTHSEFQYLACVSIYLVKFVVKIYRHNNLGPIFVMFMIVAQLPTQIKK